MKIRPEVVLMYLLTAVGFVGGLTLYPIIDAGYKRMIKSVPAPATTNDNSRVVVLSSILETNWDGTFQSGYDSNRSVSVMTMDDGTQFTNWLNLHIRRATVYRITSPGMQTKHGVIPLGVLTGVFGTIIETNGIQTLHVNP